MRTSDRYAVFEPVPMIVAAARMIDSTDSELATLFRMPLDELVSMRYDPCRATSYQRLLVGLYLLQSELPHRWIGQRVVTETLELVYHEAGERVAGLQRDGATARECTAAVAEFILDEVGPDLYDAMFPNGFTFPPKTDPQ